jgi:DNA polymerase-1
MVNGRRREFYYKLGNVLIQGSSADLTKEAMNRYYYHPDRQGRIVLVVHDEIVVSCPKETYQKEMELLRWAMDDVEGWDVPLRSEGKIGTNFGDMTKYED